MARAQSGVHHRIPVQGSEIQVSCYANGRQILFSTYEFALAAGIAPEVMRAALKTTKGYSRPVRRVPVVAHYEDKEVIRATRRIFATAACLRQIAYKVDSAEGVCLVDELAQTAKVLQNDGTLPKWKPRVSGGHQKMTVAPEVVLNIEVPPASMLCQNLATPAPVSALDRSHYEMIERDVQQAEKPIDGGRDEGSYISPQPPKRSWLRRLFGG